MPASIMNAKAIKKNTVGCSFFMENRCEIRTPRGCEVLRKYAGGILLTSQCADGHPKDTEEADKPVENEQK